MSRRNSKVSLKNEAPLLGPLNLTAGYGSATTATPFVVTTIPDDVAGRVIKFPPFLLNDPALSQTAIWEYILAGVLALFAALFYLVVTMGKGWEKEGSGTGINFFVSYTFALQAAQYTKTKLVGPDKDRKALAITMLFATLFALPYAAITIKDSKEGVLLTYTLAAMVLVGNLLMNALSNTKAWNKGKESVKLLGSICTPMDMNVDAIELRRVIKQMKQLLWCVQLAQYREINPEVFVVDENESREDHFMRIALAYAALAPRPIFDNALLSSAGNAARIVAGITISLIMCVSAGIYGLAAGQDFGELVGMSGFWNISQSLVRSSFGIFLLSPQLFMDWVGGFGVARAASNLVATAMHGKLPNSVMLGNNKWAGFARSAIGLTIITLLAIPSGETTQLLCEEVQSIFSSVCALAGDSAVGFNWYFAVCTLPVVLEKLAADKGYEQLSLVITALTELIKRLEEVSPADFLAWYKKNMAEEVRGDLNKFFKLADDGSSSMDTHDGDSDEARRILVVTPASPGFFGTSERSLSSSDLRSAINPSS